MECTNGWWRMIKRNREVRIGVGVGVGVIVGVSTIGREVAPAAQRTGGYTITPILDQQHHSQNPSHQSGLSGHFTKTSIPCPQSHHQYPFAKRRRFIPASHRQITNMLYSLSARELYDTEVRI